MVKREGFEREEMSKRTKKKRRLCRLCDGGERAKCEVGDWGGRGHLIPRGGIMGTCEGVRAWAKWRKNYVAVHLGHLPMHPGIFSISFSWGENTPKTSK